MPKTTMEKVMPKRQKVEEYEIEDISAYDENESEEKAESTLVQEMQMNQKRKILRLSMGLQTDYDLRKWEYEEDFWESKGIKLSFLNVKNNEEMSFTYEKSDGIITDCPFSWEKRAVESANDIPTIESLGRWVRIDDEDDKEKYINNSTADAFFYYDYKKFGRALGNLILRQNADEKKKKVLVIGANRYPEYRYEKTSFPSEELTELKGVLSASGDYEFLDSIDYVDVGEFPQEKMDEAEELLKKYKEADIIVFGIDVADYTKTFTALKNIGYVLDDSQKVYAFSLGYFINDDIFQFIKSRDIEAAVIMDVGNLAEREYDCMQKLLNGEEVQKMNPIDIQIVTPEMAKHYEKLSCYRIYQEYEENNAAENED